MAYFALSYLANPLEFRLGTQLVQTLKKKLLDNLPISTGLHPRRAKSNLIAFEYRPRSLLELQIPRVKIATQLHCHYNYIAGCK